jgi:hypothetical protein
MFVKNDVGKPSLVPEEIEVAMIDAGSESRNEDDATGGRYRLNTACDFAEYIGLKLSIPAGLSERGDLHFVSEHHRCHLTVELSGARAAV